MKWMRDVFAQPKVVERVVEQEPAEQPFKLSQEEFNHIIESLDQTGGYLIKEWELRHCIEEAVNKDRKMRALSSPHPYSDGPDFHVFEPLRVSFPPAP